MTLCSSFRLASALAIFFSSSASSTSLLGDDFGFELLQLVADHALLGGDFVLFHNIFRLIITTRWRGTTAPTGTGGTWTLRTLVASSEHLNSTLIHTLCQLVLDLLISNRQQPLVRLVQARQPHQQVPLHRLQLLLLRLDLFFIKVF